MEMTVLLLMAALPTVNTRWLLSATKVAPAWPTRLTGLFSVKLSVYSPGGNADDVSRAGRRNAGVH